VIPGTRVTVEVNEAFVNLTRVLDAARPAEVNSALTAVADAVDQRGEVIGRLISQTDAYLTSFNPSLQTLSDDLRVVDDVADIYDVVRPDLVDTIDDAGATSETVVAQQASLRALTLSLTSFSDSTDVLLRTSQAGLETSLKLLDPVTEVLARYSPELPCLLTGLAGANKLAESAVGGMNPGVTTYTRIVPGRESYQTPDELAVLGEDRGPACYGLPYVTPAESDLSYVDFETGTNPYSQPAPSLAPTDLLTSQLARVLGQGGARP
jgi:ABC-type transporter Mla subunit MlaD